MYEEWIISRIKDHRGYEGAFIPAVPVQPPMEEELEQERPSDPRNQEERGVIIIERDED